MTNHPRFTTGRRVSSGDEMGWGMDSGRAWSDAIVESDQITVSESNDSVSANSVESVLSEYSLTDPDGEVTVDASSGVFEVDGWDTNSVARLYRPFDLGPTVYEFDITQSAWDANAQLDVGFGTMGDTVKHQQQLFGVNIGSNQSQNRISTQVWDGSTGSRSVVTDIVTGETYHVELLVDPSSEEFTVTVSAQGSELGSVTRAYNSGDYNWHYAAVGSDAGFSTPGRMNARFENVQFSTY